MGSWELLACFLALFVGAVARDARAASDHYGRITLAGVPIPGATVVATHGDARVATISDLQGVFRLAALADGDWSVRVEMRGFAAASRVVTITDGTPPSTWELTLLPVEEITGGVMVQTFQRATVQASADTRPPAGVYRALSPMKRHLMERGPKTDC